MAEEHGQVQGAMAQTLAALRQHLLAVETHLIAGLGALREVETSVQSTFGLTAQDTSAERGALDQLRERLEAIHPSQHQEPHRSHGHGMDF